MMNKYLWSLALASVALGSSLQQVEAGLPLPLQHLHNTTYDPNTGLEWLDLRLTAGQSYSNVLNGWNGYTTSKRFRFATRNEIAQLFTNAGALYLGYPPSPSTGDLPAAERTLQLLGTTLPQFSESRSWMFYDPSTESTLPSSVYVPSAVFGVGQIFAGYPQEGFFMVPGIFPTRNYSSPEMASALVRVVPAPSAVILVDANFGVVENRFGFNIAGTADIPLAVEACTNLATRSWVPLQTCTLTNGLIHFSDSEWTNYPGRFYRIRSP